VGGAATPRTDLNFHAMNPASTTPDDLKRQLGSLRGRLRRFLFVASLGLVVAAILGYLLLAGVSDFFVGWETKARLLLAVGGAVLASVAAGVAWRRASRISLVDAAIRADEAVDDPRRPVGAALDLASSATGAESPMERYLAGLATEQANAKLAGLRPELLLPLEERRGPWKAALVALAVVALVVALHPRAGLTVASRLLRPWAELAPYSPHTFTLVGDLPPRAVYGKELALAVEIGGPVPAAPVELLVRPAGGGTAERLPTFRESGTRHGRTLEGLTEPLEFAFAAGRARSAWHRLEILYQPRLEGASVEVAPPAYAGLPPVRFSLGGEDLRGLRGSEVRLVASSNRPLSGGTLEGRSPQGGEVLRRVEATPFAADPKQVEFLWRIEEDLHWTLDLIDIGGGRMENPVPVVQSLRPDEKPVVSVVEPGPFAFATPTSEVRFAWEAEDDFGLDRLDLIRSAGHFRERALPLPGGGGEKRQRLERTARLAGLGAQPGQTLSFLLEARDRNPDLLGTGSSEETKVTIITEEEYAAQIRLRTTVAEFAARYHELRERLAEALASLDRLAASAAADDAAFDGAKEQAMEAHREAREWFSAFAKDFPAFATDAALNELSGGLAEELEKNLADLGASAPGDAASIQSLAKQLRDRLEPGREKLAEEEKSAAEIAAIASVMEMAAELEAIHAEQRQVSDKLGRLSREMALGMTDNRAEVPGLRARQMRNRERLERVRSELPERLEGLPEEAASLREGAEKVLGQLESLQVSDQMSDSVAQASEGKVPGAAASAALALANLDQILAKEKNDFCQICQGGMPGFCSGDGVAANALAQMLAALRGRAMGQGSGDGSGGGGDGGSTVAMGGTGGSGTAMRGMQLDIPLLGPPRINLSNPPGAAGGPSKDRPGQGEATATETATEAIPTEETPASGARTWSPESVPSKYREAVKQFYSDLPPANPTQP
jgi:hypothetical protein